MQTADAVVVGAGIVGAACAERLSRDGLRVAVVEQDLVGGGATAAGMGHIVVMDDSEAQFLLTRYSQQLWAGFSTELPVDVEYRQCGTLWVAADEDEFAEVRRKHGYYTERGVPVEIVNASELKKLEPSLRDDLVGALLVPQDAVLYPPCAARFLLDQAIGRGAVLHAGVRALRLTQGLVQLKQDAISAPITINATGASASQLMPFLAIKPRKGHLLISDRYPTLVGHQLVELGYLKSAHTSAADSVAFNVQPRATGQLLIGSSRQYGVEHSEVEPLILGRMLQRALEYMPSLADTAGIRAWTGFRAATPDKLPLIGRAPDAAGLYVASGHEGLGITTSLATAALIADQIMGRVPAIPPEPYYPSRVFQEHRLS